MNGSTATTQFNVTDNWGWGNGVLYRMCSEEPGHTKLDVIAGKVWLIGRAYSAAMERKAGNYIVPGQNFYLNRVAPMMRDSGIDKWLTSVAKIERVSAENVANVLRVHKQVTDLFKEISGVEKRSLASKYLHFHQPGAFFIFDSVANARIRETLKGKRFKAPAGFDDPYAEFVYRCLWYRDNVFEQHLGRQSTPRELDQYLLGY